MRTSIAGAAFLLVGAGAATVAAVDTTGNGIALNGSDTLFDVTQSVIASCKTTFSDFTTNGITYNGGGSGTGAGQMVLNVQQIAPMSRALKNSEYCSTAAPSSPGLTEALLVGIDGVAVLANTTNSCSTSTPNNVGSTASFTTTSDGTAGGTPVGTYTFADSFDALKVLYFGLTHDGVYDCGSATRKTLIRQWNKLFQNDCAAGDGTCSAGITHAWRRSDLSGTTDAFVSVLGGAAGIPSKGGKSAGIGTLSNVPVGASQKMNPFCNSADANANPPTVSFGGSSDFQDLDPVRTTCVAGKDGVCEAPKGATNFVSDLGVVLPVFLPDVKFVSASDDYPTQACTTACTLVAPIRGSQIPAGYKCPNSGNSPVLGGCYMPYAGTAASPDPRCVSPSTNKCFDKGALRDDGRSYNLPVVILSSQVPTAQRSTFTYQFGLDNLNRIMDHSFFRIHSTTAGANNVPNAATGATGLCQENDDTSQIGCLVDSDPCSVGYAGREGAKGFPGTGSPAAPQPDHNKALAVLGTTPFTASAADPSNTDAALQNLLQPAGTLPLYPLARRLYVATSYGFTNLKGGESEFAQCYGNNTIVNAALSGRFVGIPGGVQCLDYPEESTTTAAPAPNVQGTGNVALAGCGAGTGLTGANACSVSPPVIQ
ncbi:MAG TPA: substrate-binding domain-containing protein [Polyangia bacterium]|nr:substrate-binding domain-containing protein [Polyangia bacterium]